jgi:hypothetical protein
VLSVQQIIDQAFARSRRLVPEGPGATAQPAELVPVVQESLYALFQVAARVNSAFYGASLTVPYASGWARPSDAELIERIERTTGENVVVVPVDQRQQEPGFPSVYRWGGVFFPAGVTPGPEAGESLVFFYSRRPAPLSSATSTIDPAFPESHRALLELDVAIRLVLKDGGPTADILDALRAERTDALRSYVAFLEHETVGERRAIALVRRFSTNTLVPLESILAGGAS